MFLYGAYFILVKRIKPFNSLKNSKKLISPVLMKAIKMYKNLSFVVVDILFWVIKTTYALMCKIIKSECVY